MAEKTILVCDVCGDPAVATVAIKFNGKSLNKDLCQTHLSELTSGTRAARRGRPKSTGLTRRPRTSRVAKKSSGRGRRAGGRSRAKASTAATS